MRKYMKSALALLLTVIIVLSVCIPATAASQPSSYSTSTNSGQRNVACTTLSGTRASSYYTGSYTYANLSALSQSSLLTTLRTLMTSTHSYTSSYNDCKNYADKMDCENNSGRMTSLYTSYVTNYSSGGINREHVWPKSLGGFETSGPGADLHHIRPTEETPNSNRGNLKYGNVSGGKTSYGNVSGKVGGTYSTSYFEPLDNVKGDVARICLYVHVRYGGSYSQCSNITRVFESVDVLLEWCALDPVDTWEMGRNEVVYAKQGNRNVFIDYPELAWKLYGRDVPEGMSSPSAGEGSSSGGSSSGGSTPAACTHASTEVRGKVSATCGTTGYTGDTYCKSCGEKISTGRTVAATGNHTWGTPVTVTPPTETTAGQEKCTCTTCGAIKTTTIPATGSSGGTTPPDEDIVLPDDPNPGAPDIPATDPIEDILGSITSDSERMIIMLHLGLFGTVYYDMVSA